MDSGQETIASIEQIADTVAEMDPNVLADTIKGRVPGIIDFGIRLLLAVLLLFIGGRLIKIVRKILWRTLNRAGVDDGLNRFLTSVANVLLYGILIFMAAEHIGISSASIIALLGSAGVAIGLALQGSRANFAGGVLILIAKPFKAGDYIVTANGEAGTVKDIGLVYTTLTTADNSKIVIPNGGLSNSVLTNVTGLDKRRVDLEVGIGYTSDLNQAKEIIRNILETHPLVLKEEPIQVFVKSLGDSAVQLEGRAWASTEDYWPVRWDVTEAVKLAFDEAGIEIPFNQMDVHIVHDKSE